jgi:hypothetical protein
MMTSFTRLLAQAKKERAMIRDATCICGHDKDQHDVGCCLATRDCCCEGFLRDDESRNGDPAEAEPSDLSGRGWELWRV